MTGLLMAPVSPETRSLENSMNLVKVSKWSQTNKTQVIFRVVGARYSLAFLMSLVRVFPAIK